MPVRSSRSQKPKASQSQPATQTQRGKRASRRDEEDDEDEERGEGGGENDEGGEMDVDKDQGTDVLMRKAYALVRLALFNEHKRTPLKRDDITRKVLGTSSRSFNIVFDNAQKILRKTFGMEMVELRTRAEIEKVANAAPGAEDGEEARGTTGAKKKAVAAGSKTYILRSVLDDAIIHNANLFIDDILEEEQDCLPDGDDDDEGGAHRTYGSIMSWTTSEQLGPIGILYVILALILVSGRVMSDGDLRMQLKRLHLTPNASVEFTGQSTHPSVPIDTYLNTLKRQGYLDSVRIGETKAAGGAKKRGRAPATQAAGPEEGGGSWEWRWGPRAQSEVGEKGIAQFVAEFMVLQLGAVPQGEEEEDRASRKKKQAEEERKMGLMLKGIERAAGGNLAPVK